MSEPRQPRMSPGTKETLETMNNLSGRPDKPSFLSKVFVKLPDEAELIAELVEALDEAESYFDNKADADYDQDGHVPNSEMVLLTKIRSALAKAEIWQKVHP